MRDPQRALAETLDRIDSLLREGQARSDVLDVHRLSVDSGVPVSVVEMLLAGQEAPAEDIVERIVRRIVHLRETRRRPDGSRHSYDEIASSFGATRASLSNLVNGYMNPKKPRPVVATSQRPARSGGPLASTQAGVERFFFGEPNGWLSAEPASALSDALKSVVVGLRAVAVPEPYDGLRAMVLRTAANLPDDEWKLLERFIASLAHACEESPQAKETMMPARSRAFKVSKRTSHVD